MDSYGSSELQTEVTSQGTDERSNPDRSKWVAEGDDHGQKRTIGSPRRMDSGYADAESTGGGEAEGHVAGDRTAGASRDKDVPNLELNPAERGGEGSGMGKGNQGEQKEYDWDCRDILAAQEDDVGRYALVVLNQGMPARWVFEQVWKSGKFTGRLPWQTGEDCCQK